MLNKKSYLYNRYSIWFSAFIVIVLIIILGYAVYRSREKSIVNLFTFQQAVISNQAASLVNGTISNCGNSLDFLAKTISQNNPDAKARYDSYERFYNETQDIIQAIVEIDASDTVISVFPEKYKENFSGKKIDNAAMRHSLEKLAGGRYSGGLNGLFGKDTITDPLLGKSIGMGYKLIDSSGRYTGAVVALLSPQMVVRHAVLNRSTHIGEFIFVDNSGKIVFHQDSRYFMKDLKELVDKPLISFNLTKGGSRYFIDSLIRGDGSSSKSIVSYAPVAIGNDAWLIILTEPYDRIHNLIVSVSGNILLGAAALILVVLVAAVSITRADVKRLRLKEELKRLQERQEWQSRVLREKIIIGGIIEGSPVPTFVIDKGHKVILWNRACTDLTGFNSKMMVGTGNYYQPFYKTRRPMIADFIIDNNTKEFDEYYGKGKVKKSEIIEGAYEAVKFFEDINGKQRHLYFIAAPIYDEKGEVSFAIETFHDVTKEVELTRSLQEYAETLQNELEENMRLRKDSEYLRNYLESLIDSLPERLFDLNRDGIINYINKQTLIGRNVESELKGRHFTEVVDQKYKEYVISKWEDAQRGIFNPYEIDAVNKKGEKRHLLITPAPIKGTDRYVLVQQDITEFKELEKKYYESQKLAAIGQLSAGIAHEVRNPLSSIKMSLQILEKRLKPEGNDLQRFKIAQREVEHLEKLVSDVLIYSKPLRPNKELNEMPTIIESSLSMVEKSLSEKRIKIIRSFPPGLPLIECDPLMINQALINVIQNAADAMEDEGTLELSVKVDEGRMLVEVKDNGCGIDEGDMPHLFNLFFTKKNYGTGLGLSQVRKIIDQHEGEIEIISSKGEGTRFLISLPLNP